MLGCKVSAYQQRLPKLAGLLQVKGYLEAVW